MFTFFLLYLASIDYECEIDVKFIKFKIRTFFEFVK